MSKIPQMIYFEEKSFLELVRYKQDKHFANNSQAINQLIIDFLRFRAIANKLNDELRKQEKKENEIKNKNK